MTAVANMSLSGGALRSLDDAVRKSAGTGVLYAVAAGNSGPSPVTTSLARAGAGTSHRGRHRLLEPGASWSNYGSCVRSGPQV